MNSYRKIDQQTNYRNPEIELRQYGNLAYAEARKKKPLNK